MEEGASLRVRVRPRASRDEIVGARDGSLLVSLAAAPVEGEANASLVRLLGRALRVPPSSIRIVRGLAARHKLVCIHGLSAATLRERLEAGGAER